MSANASPETEEPPAKSGRFAQNVRWQFVANGAQAVLGGGYLLVLGRFLGPADFGTFSVVMALVSVAGLLLELRLQDVVAREFAHADEGGGARADDGARILDLFFLEVVTRTIPCLGLVLLSIPLARISHLPGEVVPVIVVAAAGFLLSKSGWGTSTGLLRALGRTDVIALCLSGDWGLRLVLTAVCFFISGMTIHLAVVITVVAGTVGNLAQIVLAGREFHRRVAPLSLVGWTCGGAMARLQKNRRLLAANFVMSASDLMSKDVDVAMISSILTADKVGLYKMAKSIVQSMWRAIDPFYLAIMPEVQKLWSRGDDDALRAFLKKTSLRLFALSVALVCVGGVGVMLFLQPILGAGYAEVPPLIWLMSGWVIVCGPLVWGHPLAVAINRPELAVVGSLLGSAIGLGAFFLLTPRLGLTGAALAWVLTLLVNFGTIAVLASFAAARLRGSPDDGAATLPGARGASARGADARGADARGTDA